MYESPTWRLFIENELAVHFRAGRIGPDEDRRRHRDPVMRLPRGIVRFLVGMVMNVESIPVAIGLESCPSGDVAMGPQGASDPARILSCGAIRRWRTRRGACDGRISARRSRSILVGPVRGPEERHEERHHVGRSRRSGGPVVAVERKNRGRCRRLHREDRRKAPLPGRDSLRRRGTRIAWDVARVRAKRRGAGSRGSPWGWDPRRGPRQGRRSGVSACGR